MSWFTEENSQQIPQDDRSLTVAFANLLQKLDVESKYPPVALHNLLTQDDPGVDWWSIAEYIPEIEIKEVNPDLPSWPQTANAIVKFRRMDVASAGVVEHYALIADWRTRSIIDSLDGRIKTSSEYGDPTGWASYMVIDPDPELEALEAKTLTESGNNKPDTYILQAGENLWDAARKLHLRVDDLVKFNSIDDPRGVKAGYKLHLPTFTHDDKHVVKYEILEKPVNMHVSNRGGTTKYSFGHARKWEDIIPTGRRHAENSNHTILAIAHVQLEEEDTTAAYYMDSIDLGNYRITGRPQFTTGFNHSHLSEGVVVPSLVIQHEAEPEPEAEEAVELPKEDIKVAIKESLKAIDGFVAPVSVPEPVVSAPDPQPHPEPFYKQTLTALKDDRGVIPFMAQEDVLVHEAEEKRPPRPLKKGQTVHIAFTFEKDGVLYGLADGPFQNNLWFGIPMDKIASEEELFNFDIPLTEKVAYGTSLSLQERGVVVLSKILSQGIRARVWIANKKLTRSK